MQPEDKIRHLASQANLKIDDIDIKRASRETKYVMFFDIDAVEAKAIKKFWQSVLQTFTNVTIRRAGVGSSMIEITLYQE